MGKKILLPTDFSLSSWHAIQYAIKLFEKYECDFYILNTYVKDAQGLDNITLLDPDEAFNKMSEKKSKEGLGDILTQLLLIKTPLNHRFHVLSRSTVLVNAIKDVAESLKIDMIIMGAKGMSNKKGRYGKNTLAVIENNRTCPIIIVPKNVSLGNLKEIVFTTNFNVNLNENKVKSLAEIAKIYNAKVQILSLVKDKNHTKNQQKNKLFLQEQLKGIDHEFNVLQNVKLATALSCFVTIKHSNMISYINKKPSIWKILGFGKPNLEHLGFFKDVPVLALHE
ncbi:universal stress protein [Aurantibacter sp.]|uniref:universal stress protein n=1 Tax=Aurantibacter sp. TaxID=2807103 RepID=UPI0032677FE4